MRYERLSDRLFRALKYNIVLQGSIFSSDGFYQCYGIIVLFVYKVLLYGMFKGFKAVGVCGVVVCKDNDKVVECSIVVVGQVGCDDDRLVVVVVGQVGVGN